MDPFGASAVTTATVVSTLLAYRAVKKQSLTKAGAVTGCIVGFLLVGTGLRGLTLFFMYQLGSWATKYKADIKARCDETVATASIRGARQVLAVSVTAVFLSLYHAWHYGPEQAYTTTTVHPSSSSSSSPQSWLSPHHLAAAILAHHAVSLGDTLASELGMATAQPTDRVRLCIPPFDQVPPGTNGGMTVRGTLWSLVGGALCGLFAVAMDGLSGLWPSHDDDGRLLLDYTLRVVWFATLCGGLGSWLDSLLGATVQVTYWDEETKQVCHAARKDNDNHKKQQPRRKRIAGWIPFLSNEGVNFVSVVLTTVLGGWILAPWILIPDDHHNDSSS